MIEQEVVREFSFLYVFNVSDIKEEITSNIFSHFLLLYVDVLGAVGEPKSIQHFF